MGYQRRELVKKAMYKAMEVRRILGKRSESPLCIYDAVTDLGIDMRFDDLPTVEGIYYKANPPLIVVTSRQHRPSGRQAYNCGHELGHHVFNHGTQVDNMIGSGSSTTDEFLVQCFAGFLLMPKVAVLKAFHIRGWSPTDCTPQQVYVVSNVLGVGYTTLIDHMEYTLNIINGHSAKVLRATKPKEIRNEILQFEVQDELTVADKYWPAQDRAIDVQVGDYIHLPARTQVEGNSLELIEKFSGGWIYKGGQPGISRCIHPETGWASFVRVSPKNYIGWAKYRHLEDPDHE